MIAQHGVFVTDLVVVGAYFNRAYNSARFGTNSRPLEFCAITGYITKTVNLFRFCVFRACWKCCGSQIFEHGS